mgnify:CR=1 FL=1
MATLVQCDDASVVNGACGKGVAAAERAAVVPLLVALLAGNPVTSFEVLQLINTRDATVLRRLHPAVARTTEAVVWCDCSVGVTDVVRWRVAFPAAIGAHLRVRDCSAAPQCAALVGLTHLECTDVQGLALGDLPATLQTLKLQRCTQWRGDELTHTFASLRRLDCSDTPIGDVVLAVLPPSLQSLRLHNCGTSSAADFRHLHALRALDVACDAVFSTNLPPSLVELTLDCRRIHHVDGAASTPFGHLVQLQTLQVKDAVLPAGYLPSLPPSLTRLGLPGCKAGLNGTFPSLPALEFLDVSRTDVGDAALASLPPSLRTLDITNCKRVTPAARLDHLPCLTLLHCSGTAVAPATVAACRARGCAAPDTGQLEISEEQMKCTLAALPDGWLATCYKAGFLLQREVVDAPPECRRVLDTRAGHDWYTQALVALPDGHSLAAGDQEGVCIYDTRDVGHHLTRVTIHDGFVKALAVLPDGRLAVGYIDGKILVVGVETGATAVTMENENPTYRSRVVALAALRDGGTLASASSDGTLRLWNVATRKCVAVLPTAPQHVVALAVLPDGRLAAGMAASEVWVWDVSDTAAPAWTATLRTGALISAMAALPCGRLVVGVCGGLIEVWEVASAAPCRATRTLVLPGHSRDVLSFAPLPDGRFASGSWDRTVRLWALPPAVT